MKYKFIVIGGGFFGARLACVLSQEFQGKVLLIEKDKELLKRASYNNQARVHNGYHYPRSIITAMRSRVNFPRFVQDYKACIDDTFKKYYAIASLGSKVNAQQFKLFYDKIGCPIKKAPQSISNMFNPDLIESVFEVQEYAFDAVKLREIILPELEKLKVTISYETEGVSIFEENNLLKLNCKKNGEDFLVEGEHVFNCTYSNLNSILKNSNLTKINLKQELTELALVEVPDILKKVGITVMCGPFFSVMPFPSKNLHTFTHVRYTPHHYWYDQKVDFHNDDYFHNLSINSNYISMAKDAIRYMPILKDCIYKESLYEVKTILPSSEFDDSRPIYFNKNTGIKKFYCIMGGKIDNIYDMEDEVKDLNINY
ncbi:MAG: FAD-dependent oxidoreductase [Cytophagaceae bacterium]